MQRLLQTACWKLQNKLQKIYWRGTMPTLSRYTANNYGADVGISQYKNQPLNNKGQQYAY